MYTQPTKNEEKKVIVDHFTSQYFSTILLLIGIDLQTFLKRVYALAEFDLHIFFSRVKTQSHPFSFI